MWFSNLLGTVKRRLWSMKFSVATCGSSRWQIFYKIGVSQNSLENTCAGVSLYQVTGSQAFNFIKKEIRTHVFSCEFCEIFKNTFFREYLRATVSAPD